MKRLLFVGLLALMACGGDENESALEVEPEIAAERDAWQAQANRTTRTV
jgi:hypothetical protein